MGQIGKREIAALQPGQVIWDGAISGFGARRQVGTVSYMLIYRTAEGRQRWHTIGSPWTAKKASTIAKDRGRIERHRTTRGKAAAWQRGRRSRSGGPKKGQA
jgi:hypothetical protein